MGIMCANIPKMVVVFLAEMESFQIKKKRWEVGYVSFFVDLTLHLNLLPCAFGLDYALMPLNNHLCIHLLIA